MFKQLILIGAAMLGAGLSLTAAAAVSPISANITCPTTQVGMTNTCVIDAPVQFTGTGTGSTCNGPWEVGGNTTEFQLVSTGNAAACKSSTDYTSASTCVHAYNIKFKPQTAGNKVLVINLFIRPKNSSCSPSTKYQTLWVTGTAQADPVVSYAWDDTAAFSSCTGGSGTWSYGDWAPAVGGRCTQSLAQTRSADCSANENSAIQSRSVVCRRSTDNAVVAESNCTAPKPATSQLCTPTSGFSCGSPEAVTRSVPDLSSCTYSWRVGEYGTCAGGTFSWLTGDWAPSSGCGLVTQFRSVSCAVDANSGTQTRAVDCVRSDDAVADASMCEGAAPVASAACTPSVEVCGATPATEQTRQFDNDCPSGGDGGSETPPGPTPVKKELCTPDAPNHKYCVWMPL